MFVHEFKMAAVKVTQYLSQIIAVCYGFGVNIRLYSSIFSFCYSVGIFHKMIRSKIGF